MRRLAILFITFSLIITGLTACTKPTHPPTATELLALGEKYLLELNYEQALVQFNKVIEIEPMNPRGYTGAAESYVALGQEEEAVKILQQGYEAIGSEEIKELLDSTMAEAGDGETELQAEQPSGSREAEEEEPWLPQPKEGYPKTERVEDVYGGGYQILEYNEYGNIIKVAHYDGSDSLFALTEYLYDDYQNRTKAMSTFVDDDPDRKVVRSEVLYDYSGREVKKTGWSKNGGIYTNIYDFIDGNRVNITISGTEDEFQGVFYFDYEKTIIHQMQSADNIVWAGMNFSVSPVKNAVPLSLKVEEYSEGELVFEKEYPVAE